jgi:hypothetical protein
MKKTYADICLERAEKATSGPWKMSGSGFNLEVSSPKENLIIHSVNGHKAIRWHEVDVEFIAHSRTDVPELARRLKRAVEYLRLESNCSGKKILNTIADELEAMTEES